MGNKTPVLGNWVDSSQKRDGNQGVRDQAEN